MKLFFSALIISLRRSIFALLCVALCLALIVGSLSVIIPDSATTPVAVKIAVISHDNSPLLISLVESMVSTRFKGLASLTVCKNEQEAVGYAAVISLPNGFWNSLMTGENLSPIIALNVSSPIEGLWVSQLAQSGAHLLTQAQHAMGGLYTAMKADGLSDSEIDEKMFAADMAILNDYLTRKGRFNSVQTNATGGISAMQYYSASAASFVLFLMLFLFFSPISILKHFSCISRRKAQTFAAAFFNALLACFLLCLIAGAILNVNVSSMFNLNLLLAVLLCSCLVMFFGSAFPNAACCAAATAGAGLIQALFGGALLPEELLPASLAPLCNLLPLSLLRRLFASLAYNAAFEGTSFVLAWCALLLILSTFFWSRTEAMR